MYAQNCCAWFIDDDNNDTDYQLIWRYITLIIDSREKNKTQISESVEC